MNHQVNENEKIKARSNGLRGTLEASIADTVSGALNPDDAQICKFHGFYEQDDRDIRQERQEAFLEPYYSFMLRARLPGGVCTPEQWLTIDDIGRRLGNGTIRLTTRQTFQYHGILKRNLKPLIQGINEALIDSIGGCGDINRNVMSNPNPEQSALHAEVYDWAKRISEHLIPESRAYHEIWLDGERVDGGQSEPIYGETYLPRKFKTAVAIPPHNDVDVYTNDLGFVAIVENDELIGFNVLAGGGMGTTHGDVTTFPRLADELGFVTPGNVLAVAEAVVTAQRDHGNRVSRRHARLKYTIEKLGVDAFRQEVEERAGIRFAPPRPLHFSSQGDRYGWVDGTDGKGYLTLYVENGRVADSSEAQPMTGLREIARIHQGDFRITPNQNLVVAGIVPEQREQIEALAREYGLLYDTRFPVRVASIACVALPTCPQAMAEAERIFPDFIARIEKLLLKHSLEDEDLVIRMTGCPNGCARPFVAEIGLVGKAPGRYNLLIGGDGVGKSLARLYRENASEDAIVETLDELFRRYAKKRLDGERIGEFAQRLGLINPVLNPSEDFHEAA